VTNGQKEIRDVLGKIVSKFGDIRAALAALEERVAELEKWAESVENKNAQAEAEGDW
jgi:hypothetical protein